MGRKTKVTCQRLIKINQTEPQIKQTYQPLFPSSQYGQTNNTEADMKHIVGWRSAGKTQPGRYEKARDADQN